MSSDQLDLWLNSPDDEWLPFVEARKIVYNFNLEYQEDWIEYTSELSVPLHPLPTGIPKEPDIIYKYCGWKNWYDWLVPKSRQIKYSSFFDSREYARCLRLPNQNGWKHYLMHGTPLHNLYGLTIPKKPQLEYKLSGWIDWSDWLGLDIRFHSYEETKRFVHSLKLKSKTDWEKYCCGNLNRPIRKPKVIFRYPEIAYQGHGWKSWEDWLGISC